jgi:hypothetical protein
MSANAGIGEQFYEEDSSIGDIFRVGFIIRT